MTHHLTNHRGQSKKDVPAVYPPTHKHDSEHSGPARLCPQDTVVGKDWLQAASGLRGQTDGQQSTHMNEKNAPALALVCTAHTRRQGSRWRGL